MLQHQRQESSVSEQQQIHCTFQENKQLWFLNSATLGQIMCFQLDFLQEVSVKGEGFSKAQLPKQYSSPNFISLRMQCWLLSQRQWKSVLYEKYIPCVAADSLSKGLYYCPAPYVSIISCKTSPIKLPTLSAPCASTAALSCATITIPFLTLIPGKDCYSSVPHSTSETSSPQRHTTLINQETQKNLLVLMERWQLAMRINGG